MSEHILLVMAKRNGRYIAGAINFIGAGCALRPQLGRDRGASLPAFRGLLLSGDRIRDRARPRPGRGGRARGAQAGARLWASRDLFGARHRRQAVRPRDRRLSRKESASRSMRRSEYAEAAPFKKGACDRPGRQIETGAGRCRRRPMTEQYFRENPARRNAVSQGL